MRLLKASVLAIALLQASLSESQAAEPSCPSGLSPMIRVELYFGLAIPGGGHVTVQQWGQFADEVLAATFPAGFTVQDGAGQWRDKSTRKFEREMTKVVVAALPPAGAMEAAKVAANAYTTRFKQQSVGVMVSSVCAAF